MQKHAALREGLGGGFGRGAGSGGRLGVRRACKGMRKHAVSSLRRYALLSKKRSFLTCAVLINIVLEAQCGCVMSGASHVLSIAMYCTVSLVRTSHGLAVRLKQKALLGRQTEEQPP